MICYSLQRSIDWTNRGTNCKIEVLVPSSTPKQDGSVVLVQDRFPEYKILLHCLEHNEDILLDALFKSNHIAWSRMPLFAGVTERISVKLEERLRNEKILRSIVKCVYLWMPAERALAELPLLSLPDELELRDLTLDDAEYVDKHYPNRSPVTIFVTRDAINFSITQGLSRKSDGKLVAWAMHSMWGRIGQLMVLPEYRGRGCANIVVSRLARVIAKAGFDPYCNVDEDNVPSLGLFRKLGFVEYSSNSYLITGLEK